MNAINTTTVACTHCAGRGKIAKFAHIDDGICFECDGTGVTEIERSAPMVRVPRNRVSPLGVWSGEALSAMRTAMRAAGVNADEDATFDAVGATAFAGCGFTAWGFLSNSERELTFLRRYAERHPAPGGLASPITVRDEDGDALSVIIARR